jgi:hypothetical protein
MMLFSRVRAQLRRRILVTYRVDPEVARALVPAPFRVEIVDGSAVAGVCLIGFSAMRPGWLVPKVGLSSENVAHRIAVEWDEDGTTRSGVYIFRRHASTWFPVLGGGRLFPGVHRRARFALRESGRRFGVRMSSAEVNVDVEVELGGPWRSSLFATVDEASEFYRHGAVGWSPRLGDDGVEALELTSSDWEVTPATVLHVESSFFDSLPPGSVSLDSALVMRDLPLEWKAPRAELAGEAARV